ncbi:Ribonuclease Y [Pseudobythopirellula maris]|uniref:Ribonuclease Y n=2 Tax=Pseudobythopirellula maris TaxID=2527991 RepID=A0A5C5ZLN4_9BACT|nr:Ribonuclease Y [Pseudobythopirellula maris]
MNLQRGAVLVRLALCLLTAIALLAITRGWEPPRDYRLGMAPKRDLTARVEFKQPDRAATREARATARRFAEAVYDHDPMELLQLKSTLLNEVTELAGAESYETVDRNMWALYTPPRAEGTPAPTAEEEAKQFERFKAALGGEEAQNALQAALDEAFAPLVRQGLLDTQPTEANSERIAVRTSGKEGFETIVPVREVLVENARNDLKNALDQKVANLEVAQRLFAWVRPQLPITLKLNREATRESQDRRAEEVEEQYKIYDRGARLAEAGKPLGETAIELLDIEHEAWVTRRGWGSRINRAFATLGLYLAMFTLCGFYVCRFDKRIVAQLPRLLTVLTLVLLTIGAMMLTRSQEWRAEVIPLMLFGMTIAIAYRQETALLMSAALTLVSAVASNHELSVAVLMLAPTAGAIIVLDSVRTRSKLLLVGFVAALVAFLTTVGVGVLDGAPYDLIFKQALMMALWSVIAGSLMTCLLPLVERVFGVQTDLSLIELGDPAHPLLQELIRRAPGSYNHSITVASLAEAAAESIGARGLLVRVGAYFHDIGKMLKPGYFIENQSSGQNQHDTLVPAMSTLVIIAHVKDGADLARQNHLPECIIDFIQQHHGTTLVEYFYRQAAAKKGEGDSEIDESSFRYPGPKPQTKEAAVLMIADAVESASRTLVEPTPARIESLVEDLTRKRLDDGQFEECNLTLEELRKIGDSLVKSLTAVYHGRVKYPDQVTA